MKAPGTAKGKTSEDWIGKESCDEFGQRRFDEPTSPPGEKSKGCLERQSPFALSTEGSRSAVLPFLAIALRHGARPAGEECPISHSSFVREESKHGTTRAHPSRTAPLAHRRRPVRLKRFHPESVYNTNEPWLWPSLFLWATPRSYSSLKLPLRKNTTLRRRIDQQRHLSVPEGGP
jgi:hypothetical protein